MLGDATGIGPEISVKVLASGALADKARLVVIGDVRVLELGMRDARTPIPYTVCRRLDEVDWRSDSIPASEVEAVRRLLEDMVGGLRAGVGRSLRDMLEGAEALPASWHERTRFANLRIRGGMPHLLASSARSLSVLSVAQLLNGAEQACEPGER